MADTGHEIIAIKHNNESGGVKVATYRERKEIMAKGNSLRPTKPIEESDPAYKRRRRKWEKEIKKRVKKKYGRGDKVETSEMKQYHQHVYERRDAKVEAAAKFSARSELLLTEEAGYLEADAGERTCDVTQGEIARSVDITSAQKHFDLNLKQFGPYRIDYTRNGKHLLLAGQLGHVAALDWYSKTLTCEMNVMETTHDVKWLLSDSMFAVAQKQWVYIYDKQGVEIHCLKALDRVLRMEYLPYHFLLATASSTGYLSWLDVSTGQRVSGLQTKLGRLDVITHNSYNACLLLAHPTGTVTMWSPNVKEPLVKMLCHRSPLRGVSVDISGRYMATCATDRSIKVWDIRHLRDTCVTSCHIGGATPTPSDITFCRSQSRMLAAAVGNTCQVYRDLTQGSDAGGAVVEPYMRHTLRRGGGSQISKLQFCPYEDVLGVGHDDGFTSVIVPGSGEANYDAYESNPYESKSQRREFEVKALLEKVQPELITLDPGKLGEVDSKSLEEVMRERNKLAFLKPRKVKVIPRHKMKGRSKAGKVEKRKQGIKQYVKRQHMKEVRETKAQQEKGKVKQAKARLVSSKGSQPPNALDRFNKKKTH